MGAGVEALELEPWLRPAVSSALSAYGRLEGLTWAWLHTDPAPEAFRHDADHDLTGLIDWTGAERGPLLYELASVVMYLGGRDAAAPFLGAYAESELLSPGELEHLDTLRRHRWAVQAAYFAGRLVAGDLTGTDADGNRKGLADARRGLAELGYRY